MTSLKTASAQWLETEDGFGLCTRPLSALLEEKGIRDTGISLSNSSDVESYYDDWHLYRVAGESPVYSLLKLREQEHDYVPGFSDRDEPSVSVSFVAFPLEVFETLPQGCQPGQPEMERFVNAFRDVTERFTRKHDPRLQQYFSNPANRGSYLIGQTYLQKLLSLFPNGCIPFPDRHRMASARLLQGLAELNRRSGRTIVDFQRRGIFLADPLHPTPEELQAVLAFHTGNLSLNSFAAEIKFHADALVKWEARIPYMGKRYWYRAAIRADMQFGPENRLYSMLLCPYYHPGSRLLREQEALHGKR